ncbi:hypothetical protein Tco_0053487 [Tanacetum coccineum]
MLVSTSIIFLSTNSTEYLVFTVDGMMSPKGLILAEVRLLSTRFHVLAIISSFASTSGPSEVLSVHESHNLRDSNSLLVIALHSAWPSVAQLMFVVVGYVVPTGRVKVPTGRVKVPAGRSKDYTLWEIIEEGNSFKPVARTTTNEDGTSTTTIPGVVTAEQKILKKNDLKAQSIPMMTLPSEHLLTFNKHKDSKSLFEAIEARFGGNEATKKT